MCDCVCSMADAARPICVDASAHAGTSTNKQRGTCAAATHVRMPTAPQSGVCPQVGRDTAKGPERREWCFARWCRATAIARHMDINLPEFRPTRWGLDAKTCQSGEWALQHHIRCLTNGEQRRYFTLAEDQLRKFYRVRNGNSTCVGPMREAPLVQ